MDRAGWNYPSGDIRVSDADRDQALSELSQAFQAGRMTADEFDQRSGQAVGSRTGKELTALLADLPVEHAPGPHTAIAEQRENRVLATKLAMAVSGVSAAFFTLNALANAQYASATVQRGVSARPGFQAPPAGFDWAGTITPAAIAVTLVLLIVYLRMRLVRLKQPWTGQQQIR